jgi:hypothetical protein
MDRNHNDSFFMGMAVNPMTAAGSNVQPAVPFEQFDQIAVFHLRLKLGLWELFDFSWLRFRGSPA